MNKVLVVAPHADDESYGCGGTLFKHLAAGDEVHWLLVTTIRERDGWSEEQEKTRQAEIESVSEFYGFSSTTILAFAPAKLDSTPTDLLVGKISEVANAVRPNIVFLPFPGDAHTDHKAVFDAAAPLAKHFRFPFIKRILMYETISETDFGFDPLTPSFSPQVFIDVSSTLEKKIEATSLYPGEKSNHPFPRSETAVRSLALLRGANAGFDASEAFMLLIDRIP